MRIVWDGLFSDTTSLGIVSYRMCEALRQRGHQVVVSAWSESAPEIASRFEKYAGGKADLAIRFCDPYSADAVLGFAKCEKRIPLLYFDGGILDPGTDEKLSRIDEIWAVSGFTRQILIQCGVDTTIRVLPPGVEPTPQPERAKSRMLTFIYVAPAQDYRKGCDLLVSSYRAAFPTNPNVRLIVKDSPDSSLDYTADNIVHLKSKLSRPELFQLLQTAHYFVAPTRMESFGLLGLEAAAAGTPMIFPMNSAYAAYGMAMPSALPILGGAWVDGFHAGRTFPHWQLSVTELAGLLFWIERTAAHLAIDPVQVWRYAQTLDWNYAAQIFEENCQR